MSQSLALREMHSFRKIWVLTQEGVQWKQVKGKWLELHKSWKSTFTCCQETKDYRCREVDIRSSYLRLDRIRSGDQGQTGEDGRWRAWHHEWRRFPRSFTDQESKDRVFSPGQKGSRRESLVFVGVFCGLNNSKWLEKDMLQNSRW